MDPRTRILLLATYAALAAAPGLAAADSCKNVSSAGLSFGAYDELSPSPLVGSGTIGYDCNTSAVPRITLSAGSSGSYAQRTLRSGTWALGYNVYLDAGRATVWGDGTAGTGTLFPAPANRGPESIPIYGAITPGQSVAPGVYSDTLTVTIFY